MEDEDNIKSQIFNFKLNSDLDATTNNELYKIPEKINKLGIFLNEKNVIQLLLIYHTTKNINKELCNSIIKFFKLLSIQYINNYLFLVIILELFYIKKNIKNTIFENENITINELLDEINIYLYDLQNECIIITFLLQLENNFITNIELKNFIINISLKYSAYYKYNEFYDIFIKTIPISTQNLKFIEEHTNNLEKTYNNVKNTIEELYDIKYIKKCEVSPKFLEKINEILHHVSKL